MLQTVVQMCKELCLMWGQLDGLPESMAESVAEAGTLEPLEALGSVLGERRAPLLGSEDV